MKAKPYKGYSEKEINYFRDTVTHWQAMLGQTDWELHTALEDSEDDFRAQVRFNSQNRHATIILNLSQRSPHCDKTELNLMAFHEVMHLVLCDLYNLVPENKRKQADRYEHRVVRILENAFI